MDEAYKVKTGIFEGPMELLLSLIEKRKLFINEISLAEVTDDYLSYIKNLGEFPLSRIANFIIVAATLILIKSRSLLPNLALSETEEADIGSLENRLNLYKTVKEVLGKVKEALFGPVIYERPYLRIKEAIFSPDKSFTRDNVHRTALSIIENLPKKEVLQKITVKKVVSIEEMISAITERISKEITTSFSRISGHTGETKSRENKVHIIVGFLAMLEMVKQGIVSVTQSSHFEDISIENSTARITDNK